jgi:hypothetical protein
VVKSAIRPSACAEQACGWIEKLQPAGNSNKFETLRARVICCRLKK